MHAAPPPSEPCPVGFDEIRIAALLSSDEDAEARAHVHSCRSCAAIWLEHVIVRAALRELPQLQQATPAPAPGGRSLLRMLRIPRISVAAAVLLCAVGAAAAAFLVPWPSLVGTGGRWFDSIEDRTRRGRADFAAAGFGAGTRVAAEAEFVDGSGGKGTVVVVHLGEERTVDVAGFREDGSLSWSARRDWPDWDAVLGQRGLDVRRAVTIVSRRTAEEAEERLCIFLERNQTGACLIIDPRTGAREGLFMHPGALGVDVQLYGTVQVLPGGPGPRRRLAVLGQHGRTSSPAPCVSVIDSDGSLVQHVELPSLGVGEGGPTPFLDFLVDWTPGHAAVHIHTTEGLVFEIPVEGGRLATSRAKADEGDRLRTRFNTARGAADAYDRWIAGEGGVDAAMEKLAARVRETTFPPIADWRDR